jgi:hypothetical protein
LKDVERKKEMRAARAARYRDSSMQNNKKGLELDYQEARRQVKKLPDLPQSSLDVKLRPSGVPPTPPLRSHRVRPKLPLAGAGEQIMGAAAPRVPQSVRHDKGPDYVKPGVGLNRYQSNGALNIDTDQNPIDFARGMQR